MKGSTPPQIAEIIIKLVKDMAAVRIILNTLAQLLSVIFFFFYCTGFGCCVLISHTLSSLGSSLRHLVQSNQERHC